MNTHLQQKTGMVSSRIVSIRDAHRLCNASTKRCLLFTLNARRCRRPDGRWRNCLNQLALSVAEPMIVKHCSVFDFLWWWTFQFWPLLISDPGFKGGGGGGLFVFLSYRARKMRSQCRKLKIDQVKMIVKILFPLRYERSLLFTQTKNLTNKQRSDIVAWKKKPDDRNQLHLTDTGETAKTWTWQKVSFLCWVMTTFFPSQTASMICLRLHRAAIEFGDRSTFSLNTPHLPLLKNLNHFHSRTNFAWIPDENCLQKPRPHGNKSMIGMHVCFVDIVVRWFD